MRAKYLNKTARRRTVRPDGGSYRELRKMPGGKHRTRVARFALLAAAGMALAWVLYAVLLKK